MKARIIVVDDDSSILELMRVLLESENYEVDTFDTAASALPAVLKAPPDAAIVDLMMPGMNGLDMVQALRHDSRTRHLPVLLCSAYYGDLCRSIAALAPGNTVHLRKPFHIQDLFDAVESMLSIGRDRHHGNGQEPRASPGPTPAPAAARTDPSSLDPLHQAEPNANSRKSGAAHPATPLIALPGPTHASSRRRRRIRGQQGR